VKVSLYRHMKYQRNSSVECAPMKDESILYDPASVKFCVLNGTAAFLWERLERPRSAGELLGELSDAYRIDDRAKAEHDLHALLGELVQLAFVTAANEPGPDARTPLEEDRAATTTETGLAAPYGAPRLRLMDESEVLAQFQVTSAGVTWWVM
jgi:hypothetical protein